MPGNNARTGPQPTPVRPSVTRPVLYEALGVCYVAGDSAFYRQDAA